MLLTDQALAKIISDYEARLKLKDAEIDRIKKTAAAEQKAAVAVCRADAVKSEAKYHACSLDRERQSDIYRKALDDKKCPSQIWNYISFLGGAVVTGGLCAAVDRIR